MPRIRTIKPDLFRHPQLFDAEKETGLPLRLAFIALFTCCDREGRFKWCPRTLQLDMLPYDDVDPYDVFKALADYGFVVRYEIEGKEYGYIPTFLDHQIPGRDEPDSEIPPVNGVLTPRRPPPNQTVRYRLYLRDHETCVYCQDNLSRKSRSKCLDHVIPISQGGTHGENNLVTSCKKCRSIKGERLPSDCNFKWPEGRGERHEEPKLKHTVNTPLTGVYTPLTPRTQNSDMEGEWEEEEERDKTVYVSIPKTGLDTFVRNLENEICEQPVEQKIEQPANSSKKQKLPGLHGFDEFYRRYPRRQARGRAETAWRSKCLGLKLEAILSDMDQREQVDDRWKPGNPGVMLPATYLNAKRWEDEDKVLPRFDREKPENREEKKARLLAEAEAIIATPGYYDDEEENS